MTTLQPRLVRADTLDLQSHAAPSAQDHSRSPTFVPYTHGAPGVHHREALRNAEESAYNDRRSSPHTSLDVGLGPSDHAHQYDSTDEEADDDQHEDHNGTAHQDGDDYDEGVDENDDDLEDDLLDKMSSSPSIEDEDIDFEFVYALHTFVATVEGQANATKGDTMVLLDDSNSYWWLVRVVKDGSIGYLPAEHIETPTERLARLNKHRNIDLSASMLGDNPEKSKNPLKKAMRRRNAKTVAFAAPTYYEPSEYDYDSEDEDEEDGEGFEGDADSQQQHAQQSDASSVDDAPSVDTQESIVVVNGVKQVPSNEQIVADTPSSPVKADNVSAMSAQTQSEESLQRSRNGVVRNTDSFFKDDTVETKKISLTPRLLRNEGESANTSEQDLRAKASSDTFDKMLGPDEKSKEKDKEKEKEKEKKKEKRGVLSGLFKRKDKTAKGTKSETEEDRVEEAGRALQSKESLETTSTPQSPEKKAGKLQKHQTNSTVSPKTSPTETRHSPNQTSAAASPMHSPKASDSTVSPTGQRQVQEEISSAVNHVNQPEQAPGRFPSSTEKRSVFSPITNVLKPTLVISHDQEPANKPVLLKRAKERFAIDTSDSEDDHTPRMSLATHENQPVSPIRNSQLLDARPDSAMEVSPLDPSDMEDEFHDLDSQPAAQTPNNMIGEHDIHGTPQSDTASTSKPSPSLATHTPSTSRSTPTWSDASLRSYMDSDQDIRDLLIIVHDKSNVTPVGPDHPLLGGLFMTERTRLAEMQTQLDSMLTTWISKKSSRLGAR